MASLKKNNNIKLVYLREQLLITQLLKLLSITSLILED